MTENRSPLVLDLHIPYCIQPENFLSRYYMFGSNMEKNSYLACLEKEILSYEGDLDGYEIQAVRLGGGSASVMSPDLLGRVLSLVRKVFSVAVGAEFSYDALPNTIGTPSLTGIAVGHPNRVELMARSMDDQELRVLNCPFTVRNTQNAMLFFNKFHLNNIGMTVNYGIPGQTPRSWHNTLHACTIMRPGHITVEPLDVTSYEEARAKKLWFSDPALRADGAASGDTALSVQTGFPDEQARFEMYNHAVDYLTENGYICYGVGLFCLPEHEYRFRCLRMDDVPVISMGLGSISCFEGLYVRNTNNISLYRKHAGDYEKLTAQVAARDAQRAAGEYVYGRLGLAEGFCEKTYEKRFEMALSGRLRGALEALVKKGWASMDGESVILTREGQFHYREIML